jgi:hypothetical protein
MTTISAVLEYRVKRSRMRPRFAVRPGYWPGRSDHVPRLVGRGREHNQPLAARMEPMAQFWSGCFQPHLGRQKPLFASGLVLLSQMGQILSLKLLEGRGTSGRPGNGCSVSPAAAGWGHSWEVSGPSSPSGPGERPPVPVAAHCGFGATA